MAVRIVERTTEDGRRFEQTLRELKKLQVRIGFQRGDAKEENGADICDVAAWNELGTVRSPARPFIRQTVDNHEGEIREFAGICKSLLVQGAGARQILNALGVRMKGLMQNEIIEGNFAPNAPSTIRRKKSSRPLVDTGRMRQSVNYVIKEKGEDGD